MLITTSEKLYGVEYETLDVVFGVTTHSKNIVKKVLLQSFKSTIK
ncbi:UPF0145 protein [Enterococcus faecalis EnGen0247]|nr:UPF0145 protein [Enterococcus faecalis EnGen0247]